MPDIDKINNVAVADISKLDSITFADGQKVNNQDVSLVTDAMTLLGTVTGSNVTSITVNDSTLDTGISSTYDMYIFEVINAHSHGSEGTTQNLQFAVNHTNTADYDDVLIDNAFGLMFHDEDDSSGTSGFTSIDGTRQDRQEAGYVNLTSYEGNDADQSSNGQIIFWGLGSTSYEKQFVSQFSTQAGHDASIMVEAKGNIQGVGGGSGNTVAAIDDINFKYSAGGNISATIKVWGMAKS